MKSLPRIHDRVWNLHLTRTPIPGMPGAALEDVDDFLTDFGTTSGESYEADPWLEGMAENGEPFVAGPFGAYDKASWYRVQHSVLAVALMIEAETNRVAPSFVRSQEPSASRSSQCQPGDLGRTASGRPSPSRTATAET